MSLIVDRLRLVVVIVTYNRLELLKQAVTRTLSESPAAVIVVDNNSTDGTGQWLEGFAAKDKRVDAVFTGANLGGAGGFQRGVERATEAHDPDWIILHDDDSWPQIGCFGGFLKIAEVLPDSVGVVCAAVESTGGGICEMNRPRRNPLQSSWSFIRWIARIRPSDVPDNAYDVNSKAIPVDMATFVGFFVRAEVVERVGAPRGELFIYGDDYIYTLMIRKLGYEVLFSPKLRFTHDNFATREGMKVFDPPWRMYYAARNAVEAWRIGAGPAHRLLAKLRKRAWIKESRHQPDPAAYLQYMNLGLDDGLAGNFDRTLQEVKDYF